MALQGTVKWFNAGKGYGFLTYGDTDYFVHRSEVQAIRSLQEGDRVEFKSRRGQKGLEAYSVILLDANGIMMAETGLTGTVVEVNPSGRHGFIDSACGRYTRVFFSIDERFLGGRQLEKGDQVEFGIEGAGYGKGPRAFGIQLVGQVHWEVTETGQIWKLRRGIRSICANYRQDGLPEELRRLSEERIRTGIQEFINAGLPQDRPRVILEKILDLGPDGMIWVEKDPEFSFSPWRIHFYHDFHDYTVSFTKELKWIVTGYSKYHRPGTQSGPQGVENASLILGAMEKKLGLPVGEVSHGIFV